MGETVTITQLEETVIEDLNLLDDWLLQYEYLLDISADLPRIPDEERTEEHRVRGCQAAVWIKMDYADGMVHIRADSEALIIRGILSIIVLLLHERTPTEITSYCPRFIDGTTIHRQLSTDRLNGIASVISSIQTYAAACATPVRREHASQRRKKLVAHLLSKGKASANREAELIRSEKTPSPAFVYEHLRKYILAKFLLDEDCTEDRIRELAVLSLARSLKLDKSLIKELDHATPCDHATSESAKKVLLLYAIQRDLDVTPNPEKLVQAATITELALLIHTHLIGCADAVSSA